MTLSEYIIESVASRRTGKYSISMKPVKSSVLDWLKENGFEYFDDYRDHSTMERLDYRCYTLGPNNHYQDSNWIRVHSVTVPNITFWFDHGDILDRCGLFVKHNGNYGFVEKTFDEAVEILKSMVK